MAPQEIPRPVEIGSGHLEKMLAPYHVLGDAGVAETLVVGLGAEHPHRGGGFGGGGGLALPCKDWLRWLGDWGQGIVGGGPVAQALRADQR